MWKTKAATVTSITIQNLHPFVLGVKNIDSSTIANSNISWTVKLHFISSQASDSMHQIPLHCEPLQLVVAGNQDVVVWSNSHTRWIEELTIQAPFSTDLCNQLVIVFLRTVNKHFVFTPTCNNDFSILGHSNST